MAENSIRIVSYNVENLFHTTDSTRHWTHTKYWNKIEHISRVITNIGNDNMQDIIGWQPPAIIGLQEIENDSCLIDLCHKMYNYHYRYIHYDSPDHRGIDVGLLYDTTQFQVLHSEPLRVPLDSSTTTRDILYVCGIITHHHSKFKIHHPIISTDTLHLMVCHLPSMLGGRAESQWKRNNALAVIQSQLQKIGYHSDVHKKVNIVVMGDFNDSKAQIDNMYNAFLIPDKKRVHTHKYQGIWGQLDYFFVSESLKEKASAHVFNADWLLEYDKKYLGYKPKRTYNGYHYKKDGYSDHLPIVMDITL